jgi:hypothetical protein
MRKARQYVAGFSTGGTNSASSGQGAAARLADFIAAAAPVTEVDRGVLLVGEIFLVPRIPLAAARPR